MMTAIVLWVLLFALYLAMEWPYVKARRNSRENIGRESVE